MKIFLILLVTIPLIACGGAKRTIEVEQEVEQIESNNKTSDVTSLNHALELGNTKKANRIYTLGIGDEVSLLVYLVEELSREYQVAGNGSIQLPLVGPIKVSGLSIVEAQNEISRVLSSKLLKDPQVTLSISEYGSRDISVSGAVRIPKIYTLKRGRDPLEMLNIAGGLSQIAGYDMHISYTVRDEVTGEERRTKSIVGLASLLQPETPEDFDALQKVRSIVLSNGDSIYIPVAGKVYIDGAITNSGSYDVENNTTILSLFAMAGGVDWTASPRKVKVLRRISRKENKEYTLNITDIKNNKAENFKLQDGDLVLVGHNSFKYGLSAFWKYGLRLMFLPF